MSFVRPEIRALIRQREDLVWLAAGLVVGGLILWRGLGARSIVLEVIGGAILALSLMLWGAYRQRARFRQEVAAPGVVEVDEARISYLGPVEGQVIDRDVLVRVDLVSAGDGIARWALYPPDASPVSIPLAAEGADQLVDVFNALPGANIGAALAALDRRRRAVVTVWEQTTPGGR